VLRVLATYRLIAPGSEWRLHRQWFLDSAMADLLGADFGLAEAASLAVLSSEPVTMRLPSGEKATALTGPSWPASVAAPAPVAASHSRAVLSSLPVSTVLPSGLNATQKIHP
jgi:hypothetical protein